MVATVVVLMVWVADAAMNLLHHLIDLQNSISQSGLNNCQFEVREWMEDTMVFGSALLLLWWLFGFLLNVLKLHPGWGLFH